jgi:crossover junction endodeoxyribonuclease RuvC
MRVLGVDPGVARTGVAVVDGGPGALRLVHAECLETPTGRSDADRLGGLFAALETLIAAHRCDAAAVEQLFFATNRQSAMRVAQARGVVLCAVARAGLGVAEYTPLQVKEAVAGWGGAAKAQVGRMTCTLLGVAAIPGPDDVADACAIAICHHHRSRLAAASPPRSPRGMSPRLAEAVAQARRAAG